MKKNYNQPQTEIVSVELANMIMSVSPGGPIHGFGGHTPPPGVDEML